MRRKSLLLLLIAPLLLVLLLTQLADVQAARPLQADATPSAPVTGPVLDAGVPFTQPLLIRVRQQIPITIALSLLRPVTVAATPTATLTATATPTEATSEAVTRTEAARAEITSTVTVTESAGVTLSAGLTVGDAITGATVITGLLPVTTVAPLISTPETVALTLTAPLTDALTTPDDSALPTVALTVPTGTPAVGDLVPLTGTLPLTGVLPLTAALPLTDIPSLNSSAVLTSAPPLFEGVGITMDLDLQFFITDTMTSTVPALLVLRFAGMPSMTLPVSITVNAPSTALVSVLPVTSTLFPVTSTEEITPAEGLTETTTVTDTTGVTATEELTPTESPTATATPIDINALNVVTVTVPVTANIRTAPDLNAEIAETVPGGTVLSVVAKNAAGDWLLLLDGNWIAVVVFGAAPPDLITASDTIVAALREAAANAPPTPTPPPPPPTATPTPTPTLPPFTPVSVTTTTNANLRAGPGTNFDITGNTTFGQAVVVTARDATGGWLLLDSNNWIAVQLVNGLPAIETIPVFDPNAPPTPTPPASELVIPTATAPAGTTPITGTEAVATISAGPLLPTATPAAPAPTAEPVTLTVDENVYLVEFDNIVANYQRALTAIDRLVTSASGNTAVFDDQQWVTDMNTAIQLLRNASPAVARLSVPERFAAAQNSLANATTEYNHAADLLTAGVQARDIARFDEAFTAIAQGDALVAQASAALSAFRP